MSLATIITALQSTNPKWGDIADGFSETQDLIDESSLTWETWTPTFGGSSTLTYGSVTITRARYAIDTVKNILHLNIRTSGTVGGSGNEIHIYSPDPQVYQTLTMLSEDWRVSPSLTIGGTWSSGKCTITTSGQYLRVARVDRATIATGTVDIYLNTYFHFT
jgi:hypothetical protein